VVPKRATWGEGAEISLVGRRIMRYVATWKVWNSRERMTSLVVRIYALGLTVIGRGIGTRHS
jgi:hypothetical protein